VIELAEEQLTVPAAVKGAQGPGDTSPETDFQNGIVVFAPLLTALIGTALPK